MDLCTLHTVHDARNTAEKYDWRTLSKIMLPQINISKFWFLPISKTLDFGIATPQEVMRPIFKREPTENT